MKFTRPRQIPCELLCIQYLLFLVAHPILLSRATQPVSPSPGQQKSYVVTAGVESVRRVRSSSFCPKRTGWTDVERTASRRIWFNSGSVDATRDLVRSLDESRMLFENWRSDDKGSWVGRESNLGDQRASRVCRGGEAEGSLRPLVTNILGTKAWVRQPRQPLALTQEGVCAFATAAWPQSRAIAEEPLVSFRAASEVPVKAWAFRPTKLAPKNHGFSHGTFRPATAH